MSSVAKDFGIEQLTERGEYPSLTYRMDFDNKRIIGRVDGKEAMNQHATKTLRTQRFKSLIYGPVVGCELVQAIIAEDATPEYIYSDAPRMIREALLVDSRYISIENIEVEVQGDGVHINFEAETIYGKISVREVI